jgi:MraZ protein
MAFRGNYEYQLDDRNRVAIPPRYRDDFNAGAVMTPGVERCIQLWTIDGYEQEEAVLDQVPGESQEGREFRRALSGLAFDVMKDGQGRLLIPGKLFEYAGLTKDVVVVGARECLEIWDKPTWEAQMGDLASTRLSVLSEIGRRKQALAQLQAETRQGS